MPFSEKTFILKNDIGVMDFLRTQGFSIKEAQRMVDKGRVKCDGIKANKKSHAKRSISMVVFEPESRALDEQTTEITRVRGGGGMMIKPIYEHSDFYVFDKPHNYLTHPKGIFTHPSLLDSVISLSPKARLIHRLDYLSAGLILVSRHKEAEINLKRMLEHNLIERKYLALVEGRAKSQVINKPILRGTSSGDLRVRSRIDSGGKRALSIVRLISHLGDKSLVEISIHTGRTHQIRLHLHSVGHRIIGDPLYGVEDRYSRDFLDGKVDGIRKELFGGENLALLAYSLSFKFKCRVFNFLSRWHLNYQYKDYHD